MAIRLPRCALLGAFALLLTPALAAQNPPPAPPAPQPPPTPPAQEQPKTPEEQQDEAWTHLHSWEAEPIVVTGQPLPEYRDDELIGPYKQPRWTAHRRFTNTRVYVVPEGEIEFEYWMRIDNPQRGDQRFRHMYEIEVGLPNRFQFDFYLVSNHEGTNKPTDINEQKYELRYAFADWGEIWGNPTLYLEWNERTNRSDVFEIKALLGDSLAPGWQWGTNLVWEQETVDEQERVFEVTGAIMKTVVDEKLALGGEVKAAMVNTREDRSDFSEELLVGPSMQWKPAPRCHIDFAPLFGIGSDSPQSQIYLIVGWEF